MTIAILVLAVTAFIGYVWLAIVMFKRNFLWGAVFLLPVVVGFAGGFAGSPTLLLVANGLSIVAFLASIIFVIMNWSVGKNAFLVYMVSSIALTAVIASEVFDIVQSPKMAAINDQLTRGEITEQQAQQNIQVMIQQELIKRLSGQDTVVITDDDLLTPEEQRIETLREELRIKNEAALASQKYAEEQAQKEAVVEEKRRKVKVFSPIKISEAKNYVGKKIRVVSFEGVERQGILLSAGFDRLSVDRKLAGGGFKFDVLTKDIKTIEVQKIELR